MVGREERTGEVRLKRTKTSDHSDLKSGVSMGMTK